MLQKFFKSRRSKAKLFHILDCLFPKEKEKFLFVVKDRTYFSGNLRVVLETYRAKGKEKLFIYKDGVPSPKLKEELEFLDVTVLSGFTFTTIWHILTSGNIILSHNPRDAHLTKKCKNRKIINLWHGVAIKNIELLMSDIEADKLLLLKNNAKLYDMLIASSKQDKQTNMKAFGVPENRVIITGLPRYEILKPDYQLGMVLKEEEAKIKAIKGNKQLVLFAPTFRERGASAIEQITDNEWEQLHHFAEKSDIIFGIRPHPYDSKYLPENIQEYSHFHLFENSDFTEVNLLLKHTDILIVDFSSIWIDYLLLQKPIVGFSKDYETYLHLERGFIYDFNAIFPGQFTTTIDVLIEEIQKELHKDNHIIYKEALNMFHTYDLEYNYANNIYDTIECERYR